MIIDLKIQFWWSLGYDHKEDTTCKNHYGGVFHDREDAFNHCQNSPSCGGFFNVHCANEYFHLCPIDSEMSSGDNDCLDSKRGSNIINIHWNSQLLVICPLVPLNRYLFSFLHKECKDIDAVGCKKLVKLGLCLIHNGKCNKTCGGCGTVFIVHFLSEIRNNI